MLLIIPELDIRSLLFVLALIGLLMAITMGVFARRFPQYRGAGWVAVGDACFALGMGLVSLREHLPDWSTTVLAHAFTLSSLLLNYEGLRRLLPGKPSHWGSPHWLILVLLPGSWYFSFVDPDVIARIILFSGSAGLAAALTARMVLSAKVHPELPDLRPAGWVFAGFSLVLLLRVLYTLGQSPVASFMDAGMVHAWVLLSYIVFLILKDFGLLQACVRQLIASIERQARTDPLTGLMNRRAVIEQGEREFQRARRGTSELAALMVDLDHFKRVNDEFGHQAGDRVLTGVAHILQSSVRPGDLCARFGGEEFLLLLPNTGVEAAARLAERLRLKVENSSSEFFPGSRCTASFGVATLNRHKRLDQLISSADGAMYEAKRSGRNRVVRADAEAEAEAAANESGQADTSGISSR